MKINFSTKELIENLQIIQQVVPSRTTRPILSCLHIEALKNKVVLMATDLEVAVECELIESKPEKEGKAVLSASRLYAICHEVRDDYLLLETKRNQIHAKTSSSDFKLPIEDPEDFPELTFKAKACGSIETSDLSKMIRKTSFATAAERSRFAINGVHVQIKDKVLSLTATDGRRLANMKTEISGKISNFTAIVPTRALSILQKTVSMFGDSEVDIEMDDNQIVFRTKNVKVLARLISGRFPDYESVIPKKNKNTLTIDKDSFERIIRSAALVTSDDSRSILLNFSPGRLSASAKTQVFGESQIREDVAYEGGDLEIRFNPTYLLEGLRVCETPKVKLMLKDNMSAGLIQEEDGSSYRYVVTPINLVS